MVAMFKAQLGSEFVFCLDFITISQQKNRKNEVLLVIPVQQCLRFKHALMTVTLMAFLNEAAYTDLAETDSAEVTLQNMLCNCEVHI